MNRKHGTAARKRNERKVVSASIEITGTFANEAQAETSLSLLKLFIETWQRRVMTAHQKNDVKVETAGDLNR